MRLESQVRSLNLQKSLSQRGVTIRKLHRLVSAENMPVEKMQPFAFAITGKYRADIGCEDREEAG